MKTGFFTHLRKAAVIGVMTGAALLLGNSFANATTDASTPSKGDHFSVVEQGKLPTNLDRTVSSSKTDAQIQATFNCAYAVYPSDLYLNCTITDGLVQFFIVCSDGGTYYSPWFPAGGWAIQGSCGSYLLNAWGFNAI